MIWVLVLIATGGWNTERIDIGSYESHRLCENAQTQAQHDAPDWVWICTQEKKP
jgi:hypothetical protein